MTSLNAPTRDPDRAVEALRPEGSTWQDIRLRLARALFAEAPGRDRSPRRRRLEGAATALAAGIAAVVVALRLPVDRWDSLWAEDGSIFLQQGLDETLWRSLAVPYAGYLHTYPRLSSAVVTSLPLEVAGVAYTLLAAVSVVWVAWTVWHSSAGQVTSPWLRALLASAVVLVPAGGLEAAGSVANSHFFLVFGAYWALAGRSWSLPATLSSNALVLVATLSDPICLGLLPLAVLRFVCLRGWRDRSVAVSYTAGTVVQLLVVLTGGRSTGAPPELLDVAFAYGLRVVSSSFLGQAPTEALVADVGPEVVTYVTGLIAVVLLAGLVLARGVRLPLAALALASAAFWAVTTLFSLNGGYPPTGPGRLDLDIASRYTIIPSLLLISAWILTAEGARRRAGARLRGLILLIAAAPVVVLGMTSFRPDQVYRPELTPWSQVVDQAEEGCASNPARQPPPAVITPGGPWRVVLECTDLR